jgi:predicted RNA-binding Zn-ribbon protein involved in translation (DUF1610 family)
MPARYFCAECGFPSDITGDDDSWTCWSCGGPVTNKAQLRLWNSPAFGAMLDERMRQPTVQLAGFPAKVRFSLGTAANYLLLEALER